MSVRPPLLNEVATWYAAHGRALLATPDTLALPALNDSLREVVRARLQGEARAAKAAETLQRMATSWRTGREVARTAGVAVETREFVKGVDSDSIFPSPVVDSLFADPSAHPGPVQGPRSFGGRAVLWRVEAVDTAYVPPFETVKARVEIAYAEEQRKKDEDEARAYFEAHKTKYRTKDKYVIDFVDLRIPQPDSVKVPDQDIRKQYDAHLDDYKQEEQVRARHLLISPDPARGAKADAMALQRADSLVKALRGGADFADLARRFSQDPGSASNGGDLGFFTRERMVKEFSDTSFALPVGGLSQPVKTRFGYHIIKVDEKKPAGVRPFEEVRNEIRLRLAQASGDSATRRRTVALRREIARGGDPKALGNAAGAFVTSPEFVIER